MNLKRLFTSGARVKLLTLFLQKPDEEFFIRELTRRLDEQINSVRRELDNLKKLGLLRSRAKNRRKFYIVNKQFPFFSELHSIILKSIDQNQQVVDKILKMGEVDFLLLSGHFMQKASTVDLLLVGDINKKSLEEFLEKEVSSDEPIRFTVMTREDFIYRINCNDRFIKELLTDGENLIAHNQLSNALG
ncbi:MAG: hypothetical protein UT55_C0001G0014 [Candidatus Peregrinibacteria bacterium GW2011_GWE2_39_6]|nr:MAG: hypothetical protein UT36_C0005G0038 [Candidatus Peregrinibacteria bacterium GW2011_GWF2_39_17]KKR26803.1 MAG: hypothetical protein UT55_C0001G0014 [Candidatus Peregrinibacteria bacterium GW2011_GWE2_39_6]HCW32874.1 hypothetical protein [Candidatus Peregrinibacteria bacterium]